MKLTLSICVNLIGDSGVGDRDIYMSTLTPEEKKEYEETLIKLVDDKGNPLLFDFARIYEIDIPDCARDDMTDAEWTDFLATVGHSLPVSRYENVETYLDAMSVRYEDSTPDEFAVAVMEVDGVHVSKQTVSAKDKDYLEDEVTAFLLEMERKKKELKYYSERLKEKVTPVLKKLVSGVEKVSAGIAGVVSKTLQNREGLAKRISERLHGYKISYEQKIDAQKQATKLMLERERLIQQEKMHAGIRVTSEKKRVAGKKKKRPSAQFRLPRIPSSLEDVAEELGRTTGAAIVDTMIEATRVLHQSMAKLEQDNTPLPHILVPLQKMEKVLDDGIEARSRVSAIKTKIEERRVKTREAVLEREIEELQNRLNAEKKELEEWRARKVKILELREEKNKILAEIENVKKEKEELKEFVLLHSVQAVANIKDRKENENERRHGRTQSKKGPFFGGYER